MPLRAGFWSTDRLEHQLSTCPARRRTGSTVRPAPTATELWSPQASDRGFGNKTGPHHYDGLRPRARDKIAAWDPSAPVAALASAAKILHTYAAEALWWRGAGAPRHFDSGPALGAHAPRSTPKRKSKKQIEDVQKTHIPPLSHGDRPPPSPIVRRMSDGSELAQWC
ncbi:hypothetical protein BKA81DRAFT_382465 [Phyllosticta paracitricarpa]